MLAWLLNMGFAGGGPDKIVGRVGAGDIFHTGQVAGRTYTTGAAAGDVFHSGAETGVVSGQ